MEIKYWKISSLIVIFSFFNTFAQVANDYYRLKTGIHFDSKVSGGSYTMGELAGIVDSYKLDAAIITDHDNMKVSYGISPFQNFLKLSVQENSIAKYGVEKYLQEIDQINRIFPNIVFIPGVEAVPFYFWEGSPMYNTLTLRNWHTHLLVFGFNTVDAFENIPSLPHGGLGFKTPTGKVMKYISANFMYFSMIALYFILFLVAFFSIIKRSRRRHDIAHVSRRRRKKYRFSWKAFLIAALLGYILFTEFPFLPRKYDQYHGNPGGGPFQELINYVNKNQGMIFWAHPEVSHTEMRPLKVPLMEHNIKIETDAYPQMITETKDYTGFAIFWEGMQAIGRPGGLWDIVLDEYSRGYRTKPVWAIGELDFEESNDLKQVIATNTFIFAKEKSRSGVYDAIRSGRMYATRDYVGNNIFLDDFSAYDMATERSAFIGETLLMSSPPVAIHIKLHAIDKNNRATTVFLYKNKDLVKTYRIQNMVDEWYVDQSQLNDIMDYYRVLVGSQDYQTLATNPIFIRKY